MGCDEVVREVYSIEGTERSRTPYGPGYKTSTDYNSRIGYNA